MRLKPALSPAKSAVAQLVVGTGASQAVTLAATPILAALYTPADLGQLAIFLTLVNLLSVVGTGGLTGALIVPRDDRTAIEIAVVALLWCLATVSTAAIAVLFLVPAIGRASGASPTWLYWLPLAGLIVAANEILVSYANRHGQFRLISTSTFLRSLAQAIGQVAAGLLSPTACSLAGATTLGALAANVRLSRNFWGDLRKRRVPVRESIRCASRFLDYPKHVLPAGLTAAATASFLAIAIGGLYDLTTLGFWSMAQRLLGIPLGLAGLAIGRVYMRRAVQERDGVDAQRRSAQLYWRTLKQSALWSAPLFLALFFLGPPVITLFLGPEWAQAGDLARIACPWMFMRFLATPLATTSLVYGKSHLVLWSQIALTSVTLAATALAWIGGWTSTTYLLTVSLGSSVVLGVVVLVNARLVGRDTPEVEGPQAGDERGERSPDIDG